MFTLTYERNFDAAHLLPWHTGKCKNLHGHTWKVQIQITAEVLNEWGIVVDFGDLKKVIDFYDHKNLNNILPNPTAELLAYHIHQQVELVVDAHICVTVWESEHSKVTYYD